MSVKRPYVQLFIFWFQDAIQLHIELFVIIISKYNLVCLFFLFLPRCDETAEPIGPNNFLIQGVTTCHDSICPTTKMSLITDKSAKFCIIVSLYSHIYERLLGRFAPIFYFNFYLWLCLLASSPLYSIKEKVCGF